jgi:hypothetical protein
LTFGQAGETRHTFAHLSPHWRIVAGLDFAALSIALRGISGLCTGVRLDFEDIGALNASFGCGRRSTLRMRTHAGKYGTSCKQQRCQRT